MQSLTRRFCKNPYFSYNFSMVYHGCRFASHLFYRRYCTKGLIEQQSLVKEIDQQPSRIWPNLGDPKIESVTPPVSTTIFDISKAELIKDFFKGKLHLVSSIFRIYLKNFILNKYFFLFTITAFLYLLLGFF